MTRRLIALFLSAHAVLAVAPSAQAADDADAYHRLVWCKKIHLQGSALLRWVNSRFHVRVPRRTDHHAAL